MAELVLYLLLAAAGGLTAWRIATPGVRALLGAGLGLAALGLAALSRPAELPAAPIHIEHASAGSVGSGACRSCHPSEFASFHRSFHRTMTQLVTPSSILGPWSGVKLEVGGRSLELEQRGTEYWARLPDPDLVAAANLRGDVAASAAAPLVWRRVLLATGSHHQQVYWVGGERGNELRLLPIAYLVRERRYVPRSDAFLQPPDAAPHAIRWNSNCIQCHATRGEPRLDERLDRFSSSASELGIACEACHGPGAEHVRKEQNPLVRFAAHLGGARDTSIVNPQRLPPERASEVCGQCHAYFVPRDEDRWWTQGFRDFRPGDALDRTRALLAPAPRRAPPGIPDGAAPGEAAPAASSGPVIEAPESSLFWGDGTIRVGGREWNGLAASACFRNGSGEHRLTCLGCHSMHDSEPDDQLLRGRSVDEVCARCHTDESAHLAAHTHHLPSSPGSSCVGCHMPYTSYALFTAIRSHRIDSPSALATAVSGRPNACNLCHLDRTLDWTATTLAAWARGAVAPSAVAPSATAPSATAPVGAEPGAAALASRTPRAVEELLAGDAATRVVLAAAFGRPEALAASGSAWEARPLAELLDDPYAAVRKLACDSLRAQPGFTDFRCDFTASAAARREARQAALARAGRLEARRQAASPLGADADAVTRRIDALAAARDDTPVTISE